MVLSALGATSGTLISSDARRRRRSRARPGRPCAAGPTSQARSMVRSARPRICSTFVRGAQVHVAGLEARDGDGDDDRRVGQPRVDRLARRDGCGWGGTSRACRVLSKVRLRSFSMSQSCASWSSPLDAAGSVRRGSCRRCLQWYCSRSAQRDDGTRTHTLPRGGSHLHTMRDETRGSEPRPSSRAPGALRPRAHGGHRRGRARAGRQGHPLLGRRRPGAVPDERERAHRHGPHLVPGRRASASTSSTASRASTPRRSWSRWGTSSTRSRAEMVARARELRLPVLLLPAGALTRTVLSYVYHALASADLHRLRRTVAMQNDLLDLLIAEAGVDELLAKVSLLIGMPMLLLDGTGALVTSMGEVDPHRRAREVWEHWAELTDASALGIVEVGDVAVLLPRRPALRQAGAAHRGGGVTDLEHRVRGHGALLPAAAHHAGPAQAPRRDRRHAAPPPPPAARPPRRGRRPGRADRAGRASTGWTCTGRGAWPSATSAARRAGGAARTSSRTRWWRRWTRSAGTASSRSSAGPRTRPLAVLLPDGYPSVGDGSARDLARGLKTFAAGEPYRLQLAVGVSGAHRGPGAGPKALQEAHRRPGRRAAGHRRAGPRPLRGAERQVPAAAGSERGSARRHRAGAASRRCSSTTPGGTPTCWTRCARCWTTTSPSSPPPRRCSSIATPCRSACGASRRCSASTSPTSTTSWSCTWGCARCSSWERPRCWRAASRPGADRGRRSRLQREGELDGLGGRGRPPHPVELSAVRAARCSTCPAGSPACRRCAPARSR